MIRRISQVLFLTLMMAECKPPSPPVEPKQPKRVLIIVVPGLGTPDTNKLVESIVSSFPTSNVIDFGTGQNSYLADVKSVVLSTPHEVLITIGFSYGTDKINQVISSLGDDSLDIKLDPVPEQLFGSYTIEPNVRRTVVITGDFVGLLRASINGKYDAFKVHTGHTSIPSDPRTIQIVTDAITLVLAKQ